MLLVKESGPLSAKSGPSGNCSKTDDDPVCRVDKDTHKYKSPCHKNNE